MQYLRDYCERLDNAIIKFKEPINFALKNTDRNIDLFVTVFPERISYMIIIEGTSTYQREVQMYRTKGGVHLYHLKSFVESLLSYKLYDQLIDQLEAKLLMEI